MGIPVFLRRFVQKLLNRSSSLVGLEQVSRYRLAKAFFQLRLTVLLHIRDGLLMAIGIACAGFGLEGFLLPNAFIDGGVTGISLLVAKISGQPLSLLIVLINIPFILIGLRQIGPSFAIRSILAIAGLALALETIPFPVITSDKLLVATFGGFFLGAGIGMAIRGGAVLDGTEVLAIYLSRRTGLTVGDVILMFNILIFSVAAYLMSIEIALYAILTYLAASRTVDFVVEGVEEYVGVTIVSSHYEEIRLMIVNKMRRGVTVFGGLRGHGKRGELQHTEILYIVITRLEIARLKNEIQLIDPNAFLSTVIVRDIRGGKVKKRPMAGH
ncbi:MAG: YitT family protein [Lewinellaceae bacterium]|nr:YitT family protein [Saprospiraceae bacterium]MCB9332034.1 YitT family protein [Lewinellaceae bacterium]